MSKTIIESFHTSTHIDPGSQIRGRVQFIASDLKFNSYFFHNFTNKLHQFILFLQFHCRNPFWMGPFRVLAKTAPNTYLIDIPPSWCAFSEFNVEHLRRYLRRPPALGGDDEEPAPAQYVGPVSMIPVIHSM